MRWLNTGAPRRPARAGWANGSAASFELAGSNACGAFPDAGANCSIRNRLNSDVNGRYVFNVRNGNIDPPTNVIPEPSTYALTATGLVGLFGLARRRRLNN